MPYISNEDRILQAVLQDEKLVIEGNYDPSDYSTISKALDSDNVYVRAVATIIDDKNTRNISQKEIFNKVNNLLQQGL